MLYVDAKIIILINNICKFSFHFRKLQFKNWGKKTKYQKMIKTYTQYLTCGTFLDNCLTVKINLIPFSCYIYGILQSA